MSFHLAGIIPISSDCSGFGMPWPPSMMPIGENYVGVERSVIECAYAGCETIWLVCDDDVKPIIRYRVGDKVLDPVWVSRRYERRRDDFKKTIPIYYAPMQNRDRNLKGLSWRILHGAQVSTKICRGLSKRLAPTRYYVSFPNSLYHPGFIRTHRKELSSKSGTVLVNSGASIKNNTPLGFTFDHDDYNQIREAIKQKSIKEGRYLKSLSLSEAFSNIPDDNKIEVEKFWPIEDWGSYCQFMGQLPFGFKRPSKHILDSKEFNGIGID